MEGGFIFWSKHLVFNSFSISLNNLYPAINYTFGKAEVIVKNSESCQVINFLDVSVILNLDRNIETDIYYKDTNTHDYLPYNSAHLDHSRDNIPYNLAKLIIVFVSNEEKIEYRLNELKNSLQSCKYPEIVINRAFRNVKLQGPEPLKKIQIIFYLWQHIMTMLITMKKFKKIRRKFHDIQLDRLKNVFKNSNIILSQKQPKTLFCLLTKAKFNTDANNFI